MSSKLLKKAKKEQVCVPEPIFTCDCCRFNFETLKVQLDQLVMSRKNGENEPSSQPFTLFSRPEELSCEDCEGVKVRINAYMGSTLLFDKDKRGFIRITCLPTDALFLLKGTVALNYFVPQNLQGFIKMSSI